MYKKTILKNGLRVITIKQKETQAATVFVLVGTGSKFETKNISGISHFLEHMYFKGTKKMKNLKEVAEKLDRIGGSYNAFTSEECTGYYAKVDSGHFDIALEWVADLFLNSKIPASEMEKERGVIIEELNMYKENPMMHINQIWKEVLYGDQPAGWEIGGTKKSVLSITRTQILEYIKTAYKPSNTVICIAGNFNEEETIKKVDEYFSIMKKGEPISKLSVIEKQTKPQVKICFKKNKQTNMILGLRTYDMFDDRRYVLNIISAFLGGMMSSRLYGQIVDKMGAAYYIYTSNDNDSDTGYLAVSSGVENGKVLLVIEAILKEFRRLKNQKVSEEELRKAKDYIKGKMVLGLESSNSKASYYGMQELMFNKIQTLEQIFEKIESITAKDILEVANDIFKNEKLNLAILGPFKHKDEFENILKI
ncbi:MAG: pitrilysin family protein [Candidatus Paceibacterota bacterium]|jgi:predicted Zn-dependent peptidase|nr:insulinase family protein [bacterium]